MRVTDEERAAFKLREMDRIADLHPGVDKLIEVERKSTVERIRRRVLHREHEYLWTWDADTWTEDDMEHAEQMIGDFLGLLDEEDAGALIGMVQP